MTNIDHLIQTIQNCWSKETCYPPYQQSRSNDNKSLGQCAVTALVVQDYFAGDILFCEEHNHYWNEISGDTIVDITRNQFPEAMQISSGKVVHRDIMLLGSGARKQNTEERYIMLKTRVLEMLNH